MSVLRHGLVPPTATGYNVERSLRFNSADSAYMNRTPGSAGNRKTFTWSGWVKRSVLATASHTLFSSGTSGTDYCSLYFQNDDKLVFYNYSSAGIFPIRSTPLYRDVSAWYHIVLAVDTTQATSSNRVKLWVNNEQITAFSEATYPDQNDDLVINSTSAHAVGAFLTGSPSGYFNGYMADVHFIDGSALTPSSFGENDTDTGVWKPKAYTGSYGTNGFKLTFSDNSGTTSTTLGKDTSGNGNNWTPNNFSVTAGAGNDSLVDTPTPYGTDTGAGGEVRGNYATWNPIYIISGNTQPTFSNGNLDRASVGGEGVNECTSVSTITLPTSGKWYCEVTFTTVATTSGNRTQFGVQAQSQVNKNVGGGSGANKCFSYAADGTKVSNGSYVSYGNTYAANDVIGMAVDLDNGKIWWSKNGTWQASGNPASGTNAAYTTLSGADNYFVSVGWFATASLNFGQRPFAYTAPSGFKALCTQNLPTPTIGATATTRADDYFNTLLYTGDNANPRTLTGVGFQPDLVWLRARNTTANHNVYDAVRGTGKAIFTDLTLAEATNDSYGYISAFTSDGFTVTGSSVAALNGSGNSMVAWNWKANGAGSSNTAGSITSTVSANTTAGFSIVTYTGNGSTSTIGHGLGAKPSLIILKSRSNALGWSVYHSSLGASKQLILNATDAEASSIYYWANTEPTSTVFSVYGGGANNNTNGYTYVAYCFAEVAGFSKFGSYTGNGSADGPFVYTGFKPAWVLIKRSNAADPWAIFDAKRSAYNVVNTAVYANSSAAEESGAILNEDFLSNGFKLRNTDTYFNASGNTYIYAAFAEVPQKFSLAR